MMYNLDQPLSFLDPGPSEYLPLKDEPFFNAELHLALEMPNETISLSDLGYGEDILSVCDSSFGLSNAFRVLSDEGVAAMIDVCRQIYKNRNDDTGTGDNRLGSYARGAGYRSKFIRDFCDSPELAEHVSKISGVSLIRHSVPAVACGINYAPDDINKAIDSWHVDSVSYDMVMMVSDPCELKGGEFQAFLGTKEQGQELLGIQGEEGINRDLPQERIRTIEFPAAGYGFLQQGNMIFHRACRLLEKAERITMIPSFELASATANDMTNSVNMSSWTDPGMLPELARFEMKRASARLLSLVDELNVSESPKEITNKIEHALHALNAFTENLNAK